jgi:predicted metal-dependent phosphoesterase TrpH
MRALTLAAPARVLETPGWISADLHVHSAESFDTSWPLARQLAAFAANGSEVLVSTEHDRIHDPREALAALGLGDRLVAITGVEVTTAFLGGDSPYSIGHFNA